MKEQKSFTLIELLVVIAIIGLLASIVAVSLGPQRAKARDAERKHDLSQIRLALELYYDKYGSYPAASGTYGEGNCSPCHTDWDCTTNPNYSDPNAYIPGLAPEFIPELPSDPAVNSIDYRCYLYFSDGTNYTMMDHFGAEQALSDDPMLRRYPYPECDNIQNTFIISTRGNCQ